MLETVQMASKDQWWQDDEDEESKSVEEMIEESEKERIRREREMAEAKHELDMANLKQRSSGLNPQLSSTSVSSAEVIVKVASNGAYYTRGTVNGRKVKLLVDTGASYCAMSTETGNWIGGTRGESYISSTANGKAKFYKMVIDEIRVGDIVVRNVMGSTGDGVDEDLDFVVLGNSFLNEIEMEMDDGVITLRQEASERVIQEGKVPNNVPNGRLGDGVFGLWWLSKGEALAIGMAAMITIFFFGMGALVIDSEAVYNTTSGVVLEETSWFEESFEYESCLYDEEWDEYYDCYWEVGYECSANVKYFFDVNGTEFRSQDGLFLGEWDDPCREYVMNVELPVGSAVTVWYNPENPEDSMLEPPSDGGWVIFFCCGPFFLLILVVTLVNARFSNGPKTGWGSDWGVEFNSGGGHHRGPHYGQSGGYWGPRFGPRFRRRARHRRVRTSRRRSSGGSRSTRRRR